MKQVQIDVLSETPNCPVVHMPGRKFPGVVLQGDSLRILLDSAEEVCRLCGSVRDSALFAEAVSLREKLADYVTAYEQVMKASGRELPYPERN
jgi:hypothetical protein